MMPNIKFIRNVAADLCIYAIFYYAVFGDVQQWIGYAKNFVYVMSAFSFLSGIALLISKKEHTEKLVKTIKDRARYHTKYCKASSFIETIALASFGFYWCSLCYFIAVIGMQRIYSLAEDKE